MATDTVDSKTKNYTGWLFGWCPGLGAIGALRILERLRTPEAIFRASASELEAAGVSPSLARSIASGVTFEDAVEQQQRMLDAGARMISYSDPLYPPSLREIFDPPTVLFVKGRVELLQRYCLAVVGTRRPTPYGLAATEHLAGRSGEGRPGDCQWHGARR